MNKPLTIPRHPPANSVFEQERETLDQFGAVASEADGTEALPLSFGQERLWFLHQIEPNSPRYNIPLAVRLCGTLDVNALRDALEAIVDRHESLRTTFSVEDGNPVARVGDSCGVAVPLVDFSGYPLDRREPEAERLVATEARRPFDLARDLMLRANLIRLGEREHWLLLNLHHIAGDEWSLKVLVDELIRLYSAFATDQTPTLPELPIQYGDFALWQREWLRSETLDQELRYWKDQLRGDLRKLDLPTDRPRPVALSTRGASESLALSPELSEQLKLLSRRHGVTLFMTLLAAFKTLLSRYSTEQEIIVGTPVSGRNRIETEGLIGFFVNTLLLRSTVAPELRFNELLQNVRETVLDALTHQELPFEKIVEALHPERTGNQVPLVQAMFAVQELSFENVQLPELSLSFHEVDTQTAKFELTFVVKQTGATLVPTAEYNTDLFEAETIRRMLRHYQTLLEAIVADPTRQVSQLPLLTPAERRQILVDWNNTATDYPHKSIAEIFEQQVQAHPEAIAVVFEVPKRADERDSRTRLLTPALSSVEEEREKTARSAVNDRKEHTAGRSRPLGAPYQNDVRGTVTYGELNARANQLARYLQKRGVGAEEPVGLCVERSVEMIVGMLGILKAGGAYVPLDPDYPKERLNWMMEDAGIKVLVTQQNLQEVVELGKGTGESASGKSASSREAGYLFSGVRPSSGAEGLKPDVDLESSIAAQRTGVAASEDGRTPFNTDVATASGNKCPEIICLDEQWQKISQELTGDLLPKSGPDSLAYVIYTSGSTGRPKGALIPQRGVVRLVCNTDYVRLEPNDKVAQVSNACFDAATFEIWGPLLNGAQIVLIDEEIALSPKQFAQRLENSGITTLFLTTALFNQLAREVPDAFKTLKHLLFGGEAVDPKWVRTILHGRHPERLLHVYGPTETTTFASWHEIQDVPPDAATIPIGRPIANTGIYILDRSLEPVPVGIRGEVHIGGDGLARGYLNQPELTHERFVADPFAAEPGARLYKTGDVARYRSDGSIEFIGRVDHQVKIRGFRIELGEIEGALALQPNVDQAVVLAQRDEAAGHGNRLIAYVVLKDGSANNGLDEIRSFVERKLPEYMVPSVIVPMRSLPLNASGKIDRSRLPVPDHARPELRQGYLAPRNSVEGGLAKIWEKTLCVQPIGVRDNFFELGGHSLLAVRLFSEIEHAFAKTLPLATLFQAPTIERLAERLQNGATENSSSLIVSIQPHGTRRPFFWVHSLGGDGGGGFFYYRKLADLLGPDQPSFGIRSPEKPFTSIEEMARHYVEALREFQPAGPYFLGGFCFGGSVAFEMARQLADGGEKVGLLALLESAAPDPMAARNLWRPDYLWQFLLNFRYWLKDLRDRSPVELMTRVTHKMKAVQHRVQRLFTSTVQNDKEALDLADVMKMSDYPKDYVKYAEAHWRALVEYVPRPYPGRLVLFRARKQPLSRVDPTLGWGRLAASGVALNVIPGTHEQMLQEPNVQILARELRACLAEAQVGQTDGGLKDTMSMSAADPVGPGFARSGLDPTVSQH